MKESNIEDIASHDGAHDLARLWCGHKRLHDEYGNHSARAAACLLLVGPPAGWSCFTRLERSRCAAAWRWAS